MKILDKNGVEIHTGNIIEISGRPVKNDNGRFLVDRTPGDPCWSGGYLSLLKMGKSGKLLESKYNIGSFPQYCESGEAVIIPGESAAAREYFTSEAEKTREQAENEQRRGWCDQARYSKLLDLADLYAEAAERVCSGETYAAYAAKKAEKEKAAAGIRFYWNGIKVDGGKLIQCHFSDNGDAVTIYARDYSGDLPGRFFEVENNSDSMTDYFEKDRATVTPEHPLYRFVKYAAAKQAAHDAGKGSKAAAALSALKNPGQPTDADLKAVEDMYAAAEAARKAAEQAKEAARRERVMKERNAGKAFIAAEAEKYPLKDGQPVVEVTGSEHPAFYDFGVLRLSVAAAENILKSLDEKQHNTRETDDGMGWYYKTDFTVYYTCPESGEAREYKGRYDLGDGDGGLIAHIRAWGEYKQKETAPKPLQDAETGAYIVRLADYLERFTASGRVVSVTFTPGLESALKSYQAAKQEEKTGDEELPPEIEDLTLDDCFGFVQMLTDEQIEMIVARTPKNKESRDYVRFFTQELARRNPKKAIEVYRKWEKGA